MAYFNRNRQIFGLAALVFAAFLLRIVLFLAVRNTQYEDEVYQVTEPAHRLLFGTGYLSWEWAVGARSWLWPGLVAGLMALGRLAGDDPDLTRLPVFLFMAAASTVPVLCAALWGRRFAGTTGALVTGGLSAVWVDQVYMSVHPLSDVIAADSLVAFLYLANPSGPATGRGRLFWAGLLAGLTLVLRIQLGPALAAAAVMICGWRAPLDRWRPLILGGAIPVAVLGLLDWATLGAPFRSVIVNVRMNVVAQVGDTFGTSAWDGLADFYIGLWRAALPVFLLAVLAGARRLPVLAVTALTIFVTFSLFTHKEYRFGYPAIPLLTILAGLATTEAVLFLQRQRLPIRVPPAAVTVVAVLFWAATSTLIALSPRYQTYWTRDRSFIAAFRAIAARADLCGVGLYDLSVLWTPGNSGLPSHTPVYWTAPGRLGRDAAAFNTLVAWQDATVEPAAGFERAGCFDGWLAVDGPAFPPVCVWVRPGACVPGAAAFPAVNWPKGLATRTTDNDIVTEDNRE